MLGTLFLNLCVVIACAYTLSFTYRAWPTATRGPWAALRVAGLAATAVVLMQFPATLAPGVIADLRAVPLVYAVLHSGPVAGLAVAAASIAYRASLGGPGVPIMVISTLAMLLVGTLVRRWISESVILSQATRVMVQSTLTLLPNGVPLLLLPNGAALLAQVYLPLLLLSVVGCMVVGGVIDARLNLLRLLDTLQGEALLDALTGIANRRQFDRDLTHLRPGDALLLLDVDHFKRINDTHGHDVGDAALREIAQRLAETLRRGDRAYRYGGEEFAVILRGVGAGHVHAVAERLRASVGSAALGCTGSLATVSIGVSLNDDEAPVTVIAQADRALYAAKAQGRDRVVVDAGFIPTRTVHRTGGGEIHPPA